MAQWYAKEFGKLTGVSVRTLHHYDEIGLLKPSVRLHNGYRLYSEADLLKLQQIVALKFFGFSLKHITLILSKKTNALDQFHGQRQMLQDQIVQLQSAQENLSAIIAAVEKNKSPEWNDIVKSIEVYRMTKELKNSWAGTVYTDEQLKEFAELRQQYSPEFMKEYEARWAQLIAQVQANLDNDPAGPEGKRLAKAWMALLEEVYGGHTQLQQAIGDAYKQGKIPTAPFDKKLYEWIEKASKAAGFKKP